MADPHAALVPVRQLLEPWEAHILQSRLAEEGIEAMLDHEFSHLFQGYNTFLTRWVTLWVAPENLARAQAILTDADQTPLSPAE